MSNIKEEANDSNNENEQILGKISKNNAPDTVLDLNYMILDPEAKDRGFGEIIRDIRSANMNDVIGTLVTRYYTLQNRLKQFVYKKGGNIYYMFPNSIRYFEFKAALLANVSVGMHGYGLSTLNKQIVENKFEGLEDTKKSWRDKIKFHAKGGE